MITDSFLVALLKDDRVLESDSASIEVAFTTLYADVKEPAGPLFAPCEAGPTAIWIFLSF
jgi:hypothetical protein